MKTLTSIFAAAVLFAPVAFSAPVFEGVVKMNMKPAGEKAMPVTFSIKSGFSRMDMEAAPGHTMSTIVDQTKKEATVLMPEQKMYMVHSFAGAEKQGMETANDVTFEKTNQHEKIAGYDATKYIAKSKDATTEIWATEELGAYMGMSNGGGPGGRRGRGKAGQAWESVLKGKDIFPLRVVSLGDDGKEVFRMETTEVKKQSLPDTLFAPPADYQKLDMGSMMRGLGIPGMGGRPKRE